LRLHDRSDAIDVVGDAQPSLFARGTPGRAMMRLGPGETLVFQTAHSSGVHQPIDDDGLRVLRRGVTPRLDRPAADDLPAATSLATKPAAAPARRSNEATELVVLSRSIRGAASLCEVTPPFRPWLEALDESIGPRDLVLGDGRPARSDAVGLVDDPAGQQRLALRWTRSQGNLVLVGSHGSGTSTALRSVLVAAADAHVYVVDARGDGGVDGLRHLPGCGAVVGVHDVERRNRLLRMLAAEVERRQVSVSAEEEDEPSVVFAIDGLPALHAALLGQADMEDHARLVRILSDGAAVGVTAVATLERPGAISGSMLASFAQRWLFHLDDPADGTGLGVKATMTPPAVPGRIVVVGSGLEGQVAVLPVPRRPRSDDGRGEAPMTIGTLPDDIDPSTLPATDDGTDGATQLLLGVDFASLAPTALDVPAGEHAIILGPARSGRSTALIRTIAAFRAAHPAGIVIVRCPRGNSPVLAWIASNVPDALVAADDAAIVAAVGDAIDGDARVMIAIDDAERVDVAAGALLDLVSARHHHVLVVAAARPDGLRSMYGHWTTVVRRSRIGLVMTKGGDADGELLGEILPRRLPVAARAGLAWVFDGNGRRLVQVARDLS
jgi:S-DNA-T family DNA segregation ATPase FtsK/SpoIIIE